MGKRRSNKQNRRNLSVRNIASMIKHDLMSGMDDSSIAAMYKIKVNEVKKAVDYLKNNDYDIREYYRKLVDNSKNTTNYNQNNNSNKYNSPIDDYIKENIVNDYKTCKYNQRELANKYNISSSSVFRILKDSIPDDERKRIQSKIKSSRQNNYYQKPKKEEKENMSIESNNIEEDINIAEQSDAEIIDLFNPAVPVTQDIFEDESFKQDIIEIDPDKTYITVGLVDNRHYMGVSSYIFTEIPDKDIFNFTKLENQVRNYILSHIKFVDGIPCQGLIVRATGLQSAIMSLVKVCNIMKINLIVSHYQITNGTNLMYRQQPIFTDFPINSDIPYILSFLHSTAHQIFLYKSEASEYDNIPEFYELHIINKPQSCREKKNGGDTKSLKEFSILAKNINDIMIVNMIMIKQFSIDRSYYRTIIIREHKQDPNVNIGYSSTILQRAYY